MSHPTASQPPSTAPQGGTSDRGTRMAAPGRGLLLVGLSVATSVTALLVTIAGGLIPLGIGVYLFPPAVGWLAGLADRSSRYATGWTGLPVDGGDRPWPPAAGGLLGRLRWCRQVLADPGFWRLYRWGLLEPLVGPFLTALPFSLVFYGLFGAVVQPFVWQIIDRAGGGNWYTAIHVDTTSRALLGVPVGAGIILLGLWSGPHVLRGWARLTRTLLTANRTEQLSRRVAALSDTRAEAVDSSAAELRRIERDLHDGAQARLVATGLSLSVAERLVTQDPEGARLLMAEAREHSSRALQELRDLVRGIHPPVLADRGLADAVRAFALDSPLDVTVEARLARRLPLPLESAAYFVVSELLTNTAKHSGMLRAGVTLVEQGGLLRIEVRDDGPGGADPNRGTGLRGVARRMAAFDGTLSVDSPAGGPTVVVVEVPCGW